jgi:hypothetical protein
VRRPGPSFRADRNFTLDFGHLSGPDAYFGSTPELTLGGSRVPEPGTLALLGGGALLLRLARGRRRTTAGRLALRHVQ